MQNSSLSLGIDLGTSGCRIVVIDATLTPVASAEVSLPPPQRNDNRSEQDAMIWWEAVQQVMVELGRRIDPGDIKAIAVDGTSGSIVLCDEHGQPVLPGLLYNDGRAQAESARIARIAPPDSGAHGATSGLAKLLYLQTHADCRQVCHVLNQAEWIAARLTGKYNLGDENNCLKLGYDVQTRCWPHWLDSLGINRNWLPEVVAPGTPLGSILPALQTEWGLRPDCQVVAGTTDSVAAFLATGARQTGEAVTSLGSTLVLKILSAHPVFSPVHGVYSHRLGRWWLAGGASNSGGAVLRQYFSQTELDALTPQLDPDHPTGLDYYPLLSAGERFPVQDPDFAPRLTPRPRQALSFFQGMLEGMAHIEAAGYRLLAELGAPYPVSIRSVGGGARNTAWTRIRERELKAPMIAPAHSEACYGAALLAAGMIPQ